MDIFGISPILVIILSLTFFLPFIIIFILLFIVIILNLIDIPFKRRRYEKLRLSVMDRWIPNKKYIYLSYWPDTELGQLLEKEILPKYNKYIFVTKLPEDKDSKNNKGYLTDVVEEIVCEGEYFDAVNYDHINILTVLDRKSKFFNDNNTLHFQKIGIEELSNEFNNDISTVKNPFRVYYNWYRNYQSCSILEAKKIIESYIETALEEWGVKNK